MSSETTFALRALARLAALNRLVETGPASVDRGWWQATAASSDVQLAAITRQSLYIPAGDGTRLALDLYLPRDLPSGRRLSTILTLARYLRRQRLNDWAEPLRETLDSRWVEARRFAAGGYAHVVVDVRGSGASFGFRTGELTDLEIDDGRAICDWICAQDWSNGAIAVTGVSYEGSTAERLTAARHPAVKAAVVRYSLFDAYEDILCPGGIRMGWFVREWGQLITVLDRNQFSELMPFSGVPPVDADPDGAQLAAALRDHERNADLDAAMRPVEFADDPMGDGRTLDEMSTLGALDRLCDSATPVYCWSAWFDGGYPAAAVKRYLALRARRPEIPHRLILGPWDHGNRVLGDSGQSAAGVGFDYRGEMLRFCDAHLKDSANPLEGEAPVHYFTLNEGKWKHSDIWPPAGFTPTPYYLAEGQRLSHEAPADPSGGDRYRVDERATSGMASRWRSYVNLSGLFTGYPDRAAQDQALLCYDSAVLKHDLEVTGHPVVTLHVVSSTADSAFHLYLEEVRADGSVAYVTEGVFRAIHRKVQEGAPAWSAAVPHHSFRRAHAHPLVPGEVAQIRFGMLPVSYRFRAGSRIRLACAGADKDNFDRVPASGPVPEWTVQRGARFPSCITLPQVRYQTPKE